MYLFEILGRQNDSDRKQINDWQGLGVGGEFEGSEIFCFLIMMVVTVADGLGLQCPGAELEFLARD